MSIFYDLDIEKIINYIILFLIIIISIGTISLGMANDAERTLGNPYFGPWLSIERAPIISRASIMVIILSIFLVIKRGGDKWKK